MMKMRMIGIAWHRGTIASISLATRQPTSSDEDTNAEQQTTETSTAKLSATDSLVKLNTKANGEPKTKKRVCFLKR